MVKFFDPNFPRVATQLISTDKISRRMKNNQRTPEQLDIPLFEVVCLYFSKLPEFSAVS